MPEEGLYTDTEGYKLSWCRLDTLLPAKHQSDRIEDSILYYCFFLKLSHECDEIFLLSLSQLDVENQVEELYRIFHR